MIAYKMSCLIFDNRILPKMGDCSQDFGLTCYLITFRFAHNPNSFQNSDPLIPLLLLEYTRIYISTSYIFFISFTKNTKLTNESEPSNNNNEIEYLVFYLFGYNFINIIGLRPTCAKLIIGCRAF